MKKRLRKFGQTSLINTKGAGRPAIHDRGIRHTERPHLKKLSSLHLTIKVRRLKVEKKFNLFTREKIALNFDLLELLDRGKVYYQALEFI